MNGISDSELVTALRRQMTIAVAKQVASAGNLANVDTPDYKALEVSFASALDKSLTHASGRHARSALLDDVARNNLDDGNSRRDAAPRRQHGAARSGVADDGPRRRRLQRSTDRTGGEVPPGALRDQRGTVVRQWSRIRHRSGAAMNRRIPMPTPKGS